MRNTTIHAATLAIAATLTPATYGQVQVVSGATSVLLDTTTLSSAAGLDLSSATGATGTPSINGAAAFPINSPLATSLPTTFEYTPGNFPGGAFSGAIEHTGSVFFNNDTVEVGNFTIGFDGGRATNGNSGFFVESTTGVEAILFDAQVVTLDSASETLLDLTVDLVVSPEFAGFLGDSGLTGADVGDARIVANAVPEPTAIVFALSAAAFATTRRRR